MATIELNNLSVSITTNDGHEFNVIKDFDLKISDGEFVTLFGPNGCGKSTILNTILGYIKPTTGSVTITPGNRKISYVFQDYRSALMPWLTAKENVLFPLKLAGVDKVTCETRFDELAHNLPININWNNYSYQLSGGQAQLVSILRGLIIKPEALLLDEPFSALDYQTNLYMLNWLQDIWRQTNITVVFVSHQIDEAIYLGDKIILLQPGPTRVAEEIINTLPRPRDLPIMGSESFRELKSHILARFLDMVKQEKIV